MTTSPDAPRPAAAGWKVGLAALLLFLGGCFLRIHPWAGYTRVGFDEAIYRGYVQVLCAKGFGEMPALSQAYLTKQRRIDQAFLPPTRFFYLAAATTWRNAFFGDAPDLQDLHAPGAPRRDPTLVSLRSVSCLFSILSLLLAAGFARRLAGGPAMLAVLALMACAPTQLHLAQHGFIDGVFAFWALAAAWLLWENLHQAGRPLLQAGYVLVLAVLVLTKENAAFVYAALSALLAVAAWQRWGKVSRGLLAAHFGGALLGAALLASLAGGVGDCVAIYALLKAKAQAMPYAIEHGDGPWFRYLVDLLCASPIILLLAVGALFQLRRTDTALLYAAGLIGLSFLLMCNVKYGMNLRYAAFWDMPLRLLAFHQLALLAARLKNHAPVALAASVALIAALELRQYDILFVRFGADYEMITTNLLRALDILKLPAGS